MNEDRKQVRAGLVRKAKGGRSRPLFRKGGKKNLRQFAPHQHPINSDGFHTLFLFLSPSIVTRNMILNWITCAKVSMMSLQLLFLVGKLFFTSIMSRPTLSLLTTITSPRR